MKEEVWVITKEPEDESVIKDNFIWMPNSLFDIGISPHAHALMSDIYLYQSCNGVEIDNRSMEERAERTCMSKARVVKAIKELKDKGVIEVTASGGIHVKEHFSQG